MAGSRLDPDNAGQPRRRRKTLKGHPPRPSDPIDSPDRGEPESDDVASARDAVAARGLDQPEQAQRREIAENAYYRAEKRGFTPGQEEQDWLEAEAEIALRRKKRQKS